MKKTIIYLAIALVFSLLGEVGGCFAQAPNYLWAKSAGGTSADKGQNCSADVSGNIIVTGNFDSPSISFGTATLMNASAGGTTDMFIVKYDPSGNVLWAKSAGGTNSDQSYSCSTDASGNIIVTGYFFSPSITLGTTTLTNTGSDDMFIAKYDPSGNVLWAINAGGTGADRGYSCSTDASGNLIATGYFGSSTIIFGTTTLTNAGSDDMFIVKYDPSGNVLWAKSAGGTGEDLGQSCNTDASGNIIATGYFQSSSINFGTTTLTNANAGSNDIFIVKYDPSGNVLWAKRSGGAGYDAGYSCSADASGSIIVTGYFVSPSITLGTTTLTNASASSYDMFIVKYDPSGNVLWAQRAGGMSGDMGYSCTTDASENIIVTGNFDSPSLSFGTTALTNAGSIDIFIVKYDPSGNVLWAKRAGGMNGDMGYSCTIDASGNIIATGCFYSSPLTLGTTTLTNAGNYDMFIVKLDGLTGIEENNFETGVSIFPNPSGGVFTVGLPVTNAIADVYDLTGKKVASFTLQSTTSQIDLSNLSNGSYFLNINTANEVYHKKINKTN